jgi:DNA ligase-1
MKMPKRREFLMQAHKYNAAKSKVAGHYLSEKVDGTRCYWDGGLSRGSETKKVPWANIYNPKTGGLKSKIRPVASGLWSRYGNPIMAPDWWINQLPCIPLDGELWAGRGTFQLCRSICSKDVPIDSEWEKIEFPVWGSPSITAIGIDGRVNCPQFRREINFEEVLAWMKTRPDCFLKDFRFLESATFEEELSILQSALPSEGLVYLLQQKLLPEEGVTNYIEQMLTQIIEQGGEGVVIRDPQGVWEPQRSHGVLKYKPFDDDEGRLVGFTSGRETERGSKLLGKIGALILDYNGKRLELSGLTDEERQFTDKDEFFARTNPGIEMPRGTNDKHFKLGQSITFKYRELSDDGIPKDARYLRQRNEE